MKYYVIRDDKFEEIVGIIFHDYKKNNITCKTHYASFINCFNNLFRLSSCRLIFNDRVVRMKSSVDSDINIILNNICMYSWSLFESGNVSMLNDEINTLCEKYLNK